MTWNLNLGACPKCRGPLAPAPFDEADRHCLTCGTYVYGTKPIPKALGDLEDRATAASKRAMTEAPATESGHDGWERQQAQAQKRRKEAKRLAAMGFNSEHIAATLGISVRHVTRLLGDEPWH